MKRLSLPNPPKNNSNKSIEKYMYEKLSNTEKKFETTPTKPNLPIPKPQNPEHIKE